DQYEFVVLGKGSEADKAALEEKSIKVILNATRAELIKTYMIVDLVVSFSKWEGFNLPLVEAQTFSKPAFALDCCVHAEVTENVFENLLTLVKAIAMHDKESLCALGEKANTFVQQYTWKKNTDTLIENLLISYNDFSQKNNPERVNYQKNLVSICILTKDKYDFISECIHSILKLSNNNSIEVLIGDTGSTDPKVLEYYKELTDSRVSLHYLSFYHFSKNNNFLAAKASGEYVLFLNNDTKVIESNWLDILIKPFELERTGIVGPKLLFRDGTIQHAGVEIFTRDPYRYVGWHPYSTFDKETYDANKTKIMPAVTGACLLIKHHLFDEVGGFDEEYAEECQDIDLCFKANSKGYNCIYNPQVELYHYENGTRILSESSSDRGYFIKLWKSYIDKSIFSQGRQSNDVVLSILINLEGKSTDDVEALIAEEKKITEKLDITFKYSFDKTVMDEWVEVSRKYRARLLPDDYEDNIQYDRIY
ncbi:MAG: glycosyltransferase, partial [Gammaproteobacteria bacterium]|nr:glycosyltransferase [Gammaproteobacteria bacterium]